VSGYHRPRAITIDLDGAWCYRAIHGHHVDDARVHDDALLLDALPCFLDLCADVGLTSTIFVVTRDLRSDRLQQLLQQAHAAGHQLMSHSHAHHYDLSRRHVDDISADLQASQAALQALTGEAPVGFRAPGYNLSSSLLQALVATGFAWSSSVLPSPAYWAARVAIRAKTALMRRSSSSLTGSLQAFSPWWASSTKTASLRLREFPITCAAGLPWTGTTLALASDALAEAMTSVALSTTTAADVCFELHAADCADGRHLPFDQPDAHVPLRDKLRRLRRTLVAIKSAVVDVDGACRQPR
jgi:hypothetical protein